MVEGGGCTTGVEDTGIVSQQRLEGFKMAGVRLRKEVCMSKAAEYDRPIL